MDDMPDSDYNSLNSLMSKNLDVSSTFSSNSSSIVN